jgi:hypothetical protein
MNPTLYLIIAIITALCGCVAFVKLNREAVDGE